MLNEKLNCHFYNKMKYYKTPNSFNYSASSSRVSSGSSQGTFITTLALNAYAEFNTKHKTLYTTTCLSKMRPRQPSNLKGNIYLERLFQQHKSVPVKQHTIED
ncbi:hypothetical protein RIR_jg41867.t1 [Rhizophagus irregularis DAOM 181602=DAOM 197198]|nr:hypothetical protein RIR_jg41867.t1 [Rhizophagus irregularis DAOM 181602=DAOM 197198]